MSYSSTVLADSPLVYWRLGESSGTTASDSSGNGKHGTYAGVYTLSTAGLLTGDADTCVFFTTSDARVTVADTTDLTAFTAECWIKTSDANADLVTRRGSSSSGDIFALGINGGKAQVVVWTGPSTTAIVTSVASVQDNATHHLAATYDGTTVRLYVDGVSVGTPSTAISGALPTADTALVAAGAYIFGTYNGALDEVAYYTTALSAGRIAAHYSAGTVPAAPQTIELDAAPTTGGAFAINVLQPPTGTVISRRIGRRLTASPQVRVGGVWLATVGAAGDLVVKHKRNGCYEATWSMALGRQERPSCLVKGAPVEIYYGPLLVWTGTLDAPDWNAGTFAAIGSARDGEGAKCLTGAGVVTSKPNTAINAAITRGVVSWTRVGDFGTDDLAGVEGDGSNDDPDIEGLNGLLDVWATENDSQWYVTPDRQLIIRPENENAPKWFILPGTVVLGVAADDVTDRVFLRYRSSVDDYLRTVSYPASTPVGGIERSASIAKRGRMSSARATTIATAMYRRLQAGRTGWTNGIDAHHGQIIDKGGLVANLSLIRGGDTVRVLDHPDPRGVVRHVDLVIGEVTWTPDDNRVQLNPVGLAARTWESVMKQSRALAINGPEYSFETTY